MDDPWLQKLCFFAFSKDPITRISDLRLPMGRNVSEFFSSFGILDIPKNKILDVFPVVVSDKGRPFYGFSCIHKILKIDIKITGIEFVRDLGFSFFPALSSNPPKRLEGYRSSRKKISSGWKVLGFEHVGRSGLIWQDLRTHKSRDNTKFEISSDIYACLLASYVKSSQEHYILLGVIYAYVDLENFIARNKDKLYLIYGRSRSLFDARKLSAREWADDKLSIDHNPYVTFNGREGFYFYNNDDYFYVNMQNFSRAMFGFGTFLDVWTWKFLDAVSLSFYDENSLYQDSFVYLLETNTKIDPKILSKVYDFITLEKLKGFLYWELGVNDPFLFSVLENGFPH